MMEKSQTSDTYVSITEGFELENGYKSEVFVNQEESNRCEYDNALVLVSNVKIEKLSSCINCHFSDNNKLNPVCENPKCYSGITEKTPKHRMDKHVYWDIKCEHFKEE